jgi:hypothetical protein
MFNAGIHQKILQQFIALLSSGVPPLVSIQTIGVVLILCNSQCPQLFRVYYFRGLCAVTEGASERYKISSGWVQL